MKIYNETKTEQIQDVDYSKGYLIPDKIFVQHHHAVEGREEKSHYEVIKTYSNGGKDVRKIIDEPAILPQDAYDEYEDIQVFIPYTEEELQRRKEREYPLLVEKYIREKYTLADELAILRQRETKQEEFNEYYAYAESCKERAKAEVGLC